MNETTITDVNIPFGRMVVIILKWMLASIPAIMLMYLIMGIIALIFMAIFGGLVGLSGGGLEMLENLEKSAPTSQ